MTANELREKMSQKYLIMFEECVLGSAPSRPGLQVHIPAIEGAGGQAVDSGRKNSEASAEPRGLASAWGVLGHCRCSSRG